MRNVSEIIHSERELRSGSERVNNNRIQRKVTGSMLVQFYQQRVREQKALVAKAERTKERLLLITTAFRQLVGDENFITLLRAEGISDMPKHLATRME